MKAHSILVALVCLCLSGPALGEICAVDDVPAATLLLPYFEVDTTRGDGTTTLLSVINAAPTATLAHVTFWTDLGVPSVDFDIYLTGFDVYTLNLRDVFVGGRLPATGPDVSPEGGLGFSNFPFPNCEQGFPSSIPESFRQSMVDFHQGKGSGLYGGLCGASPQQDGIVRGYVTIDVVRRCALKFPSDDGYFGPDGIASYENRLLGDAFFVNPGDNFAQGENLIRLEADPDAFGPGDRTFYAAFVDGDGSDAREPLPTIWGSRMIIGGGFDGGTELTVWRGPTSEFEPFPCGGEVPHLPLINELYSFDEEENAILIFPNTSIIDPPPPLTELDPTPLATNRLVQDGFSFFAPFPLGWVIFDLSELQYRQGPVSPFAQGWVGSTFSASGRFSVGMDASPLNHACSTDSCAVGEAAEVGELCVLGQDFPGVPTGFFQILADQGFTITLRPKGCFSSSCTQIYRLDCSITPTVDNTVTVLPKMCLGSNRQEGAACTADCAPHLEAQCFSEGLPAGSYTIRAGALELDLPIPSTVPQNGLCVGSPF